MIEFNVWFSKLFWGYMLGCFLCDSTLEVTIPLFLEEVNQSTFDTIHESF